MNDTSEASVAQMEVETPPEDEAEAATSAAAAQGASSSLTPRSAEAGFKATMHTLPGVDALLVDKQSSGDDQPRSGETTKSVTLVARKPADDSRKQRKFSRVRHRTDPSLPQPHHSQRLSHETKKSNGSSCARDIAQAIGHIGGQGQPAALKLEPRRPLAARGPSLHPHNHAPAPNTPPPAPRLAPLTSRQYGPSL